MAARTTLALPLAILLALPAFGGLAVAANMGAYARDPIEHDDLGSSAEPDRRLTAVLGPLIGNKVIDQDLDGLATPDTSIGPLAASLAPGCTDDTGRRPSGLCGAYSAGAGTWTGVNYRVLREGLVGVAGRSGQAAPGGLTPTKATQVRILDARISAQLGGTGGFVDVNNKLGDTGARDLLGSLDTSLGGSFAGGPAGVWAWYGKWQDKNGNGVIDHFADLSEHEEDDPDHQIRADDEFTWTGNCYDFDGGFRPASVQKGYCALDTEAAKGSTTRMVGFLYPGNHHGTCGGWVDPLQASCPFVPADAPGRQALQLLASSGLPVCAGTVGLACGPVPRDLDGSDELAGGDPLLGPQHSVAFDQEYRDWTGDHSILQRHWALGAGQPMYLYDQGLLATLIHVTGTGCRFDGAFAQRVDPSSCRFVDVDRYGGASPVLADLLGAQVRPAARAAWVQARGEALPALAGMEALRSPRALDPSPTVGPVDDVLLHPGWSREPNDPADAFPAATRGIAADGKAQHHGWANDYAAHRAAPHLFGDLRPDRALLVNRPVGVFGGCALCSAGTVLSSPYAGESPGGPFRASGDHRPTLGPGQYVFEGTFGLWHDKPQTWTEAWTDASCLTEPANSLGACGGASGLTRTGTHHAAPDGWVGNLVNQTTTWHYRGFASETCATEDGMGARPYAVCHPYLDGALANPQGYAPGVPTHGEWVGRCDRVLGNQVVVRPLDGVWSTPVIVWRHHLDGVDPTDFHLPQDFTGTNAPIRLEAACGTGSFAGAVHVLDLLLLPLGNLDEPIEVAITVSVGAETVRDVDTYAGWNPAPA